MGPRASALKWLSSGWKNSAWTKNYEYWVSAHGPDFGHRFYMVINIEQQKRWLEPLGRDIISDGDGGTGFGFAFGFGFL